MLHSYSGSFMEAGNIRWSLGSTTRTYDDIIGIDNRWEIKDGILIAISVLRHKSAASVQSEKAARHLIVRARELLLQNDIQWLQVGREVCIIDLDGFNVYFTAHNVEPQRWPWLHGVVELPTEITIQESKMPNRSDYLLELRFLITEEILRQQDRFAGLVDDPDLAIILASRWRESERTTNADCHLSTVILLGSILEGVLLGVIKSYPEIANRAKAAPRDKNNKPLPFRNWTLEALKEVAKECGWIGQAAYDFCRRIQDYRNLIHPGEQLDSKIVPDYSLSFMARQALETAINDLRTNLPSRE